MLSKQLTNVIQNLEKKKFREKYNLFKVEGEKLVRELLVSRIKIDSVIASRGWLEKHEAAVKHLRVAEVNEMEMGRLSNFKSLPEVIALAEIPRHEWQEEEVRSSLSVVLNGIQDPGNLGTILRVCDWFGVQHLFCDRDCASAYNPKSVQASMGSVLRVKVFYLDLPRFIPLFTSDKFPCYGTFLDGDNIYNSHLSRQGFVVMGNEGSGITPEVEKLVSYRLTIPSFTPAHDSTESLNVGVATGIILSEFKRNTNQY